MLHQKSCLVVEFVETTFAYTLFGRFDMLSVQ